MELRVFPQPPLATNAYLLLNPALGEAVLFDAPMEIATEIAPFLEEKKCRLTGLYLTHGHWDHIVEVSVFNEQGVPVFAHVGDRVLIEDPGLMAEYMIPGLGIEPGRVDHELQAGQELILVGEPVEVRHVPGHSPGSVLFYFRNRGAVFSGDVLFAGSVGRSDFEGGDTAALMESIRGQIFTLPEDTVIFPGHGSRTTVGEERQHNPYVHG